MAKIDYGAVNEATDRLMKYRADQFFPDLLGSDQMEEIQRRRIKAGKKTGKKVKEVKQDDFIVRGGGIDIDDMGNQIIVDDFDIQRYMAEAEDADTGTLHDLKIDMRDLKLAKNFYDYCYKMLGPKTHPPFSRQMWIGVMLFGEVCPCCSDKKWMDIQNVPIDMPAKNLKSHLVFLEKGKCPKCKRNKYDLIQNHGLKNYMQLANVLGQRSGKSSSMATYASYLVHRHLKFPPIASLTKYMQASTELTGTFVSLTYSKARGVMWTPFKEIIKDSTWFGEYFSALDFYKGKYGQELYKNSSEYLRFHHMNLRFYPSGPKSQTLRGDTRIFAGLDELGLFPLPKGDDDEDETSERANADEAHKSLFTSLGTHSTAYEELLKNGFYTCPPPILFNVSSPYSLRDKMMRLLRESRTEEGSHSILGINLPTWEMNPGYTRQSKIIVDAYRSNPEKAERDWGANPPAVHSRFMPVSSYIEGVFVGGPNSHTFVYQYDQSGEVYGKLERGRAVSKFPGIVTIDAGHTNNSFVVVGGHYNFDTGKTHATTILECMPTEGRRVNFNLLYKNVILILCRELNSVGLGADQWQGLDLLYRVKEDMGLNPKGKVRCLPKQYSPKRKDFNVTREMIQSKNLILPNVNVQDQKKIMDLDFDDYRVEFFNKPVEHLMLQMATVREVGEMRCPEKGEHMTDDIFRALVLFTTTVHHPKVMERLSEARQFSYSGDRARMPMPAFAGRSGGTFGASKSR